MRVITLPSGRDVTLAEYCRSWRALQVVPADAPIDRWSWAHNSAGHILREIRHGIHERINRHVTGYGIGRKWERAWQDECLRLAGSVNSRVRVYWPNHPIVSRQYADRLRHRISHYHED